MNVLRSLIALIAGAALLASCSSGRGTEVSRYEDDEIYYRKGDTFVTEVPAAAPAAAAAPEEDYYTPPSESGATTNNYYGDVHYNDFGGGFGGQFSVRPRWVMAWNPWSGWHMSYNFGMGNCMGTPYNSFYSPYSAWGSPYGMGWNNWNSWAGTPASGAIRSARCTATLTGILTVTGTIRSCRTIRSARAGAGTRPGGPRDTETTAAASRIPHIRPSLSHRHAKRVQFFVRSAGSGRGSDEKTGERAGCSGSARCRPAGASARLKAEPLPGSGVFSCDEARRCSCRPPGPRRIFHSCQTGCRPDAGAGNAPGAPGGTRCAGHPFTAFRSVTRP
jgi:hypothetical protein